VSEARVADALLTVPHVLLGGGALGLPRRRLCALRSVPERRRRLVGLRHRHGNRLGNASRCCRRLLALMLRVTLRSLDAAWGREENAPTFECARARMYNHILSCIEAQIHARTPTHTARAQCAVATCARAVASLISACARSTRDCSAARSRAPSTFSSSSAAIRPLICTHSVELLLPRGPHACVFASVLQIRLRRARV
jgi:hypothetical protein